MTNSPNFASLDYLADAVMRGVSASGAVTVDNIDCAVQVMRTELRALLTGEYYADARQSILDRSLSQQTVIALVIVNCVAKIGEAK